MQDVLQALEASHRETVNLNQAAPAIGKRPVTLRKWCAIHPSFGVKIGGEWRVHINALRQVAEGIHPSAVR